MPDKGRAQAATMRVLVPVKMKVYGPAPTASSQQSTSHAPFHARSASDGAKQHVAVAKSRHARTVVGAVLQSFTG